MPTADENDPSKGMLGAYIRGQRQLADLSLRQLAGLTNVSNAYLSQIERGLHQPSLKVLRSIADALGLPGETLLTEAGLLDQEPVRSARLSDVETAVAADPHLTDDEKQVLVGTYRAFLARRP